MGALATEVVRRRPGSAPLRRLPYRLVSPGDADELVASGGHLGQALVGEDEDLLEAGLQHPCGQGCAPALLLPWRAVAPLPG